MTLGSTRRLTEMSTRNISWEGGLRRPVRMADSITTVMCRLSWNLGASASWNPQGLSRPVMGLLNIYLLFTIVESRLLMHFFHVADLCHVSLLNNQYQTKERVPGSYVTLLNLWRCFPTNCVYLNAALNEKYVSSNLLTYLLHGAESFLRS